MSFGMDPEVSKYFKKIISSFSMGFLWLLVIVTSGLYFELAFVYGRLHWYNLLFYVFSATSLCWLLYYYYKLWKN